MKIGIIREGKMPPDSRVPLTPAQCADFMQRFDAELVVQSSEVRCYKDGEYKEMGIKIVDNVDDCSVLLGVKEVNISDLIENKTYFFFSHTIKKQSYNLGLLKAIVDKNIRLIDYEVLTNKKKSRLIAFGVFAGMVGAHNALWTYGNRTKSIELPRLKDCFDYAEAVNIYKDINWPTVKIVLTGTGRVATGAAKVLTDMGIKKVEAQSFLKDDFDEAVFCQLGCGDYVQQISGEAFEKRTFYNNPKAFESSFKPYTEVADIFINGIYWDNDAPVFFTKEDMQSADFNIKVVADVTCDIAPVSSVPSTLKASTIAVPVFGYNTQTGSEDIPYQEGVVDMMTIDNLPNELPRDASYSFGEQFLEYIAPELSKEFSDILHRASVTQDKDLGEHFEYLRDYFEGK